jgi:hypothetical protein
LHLIFSGPRGSSEAAIRRDSREKGRKEKTSSLLLLLFLLFFQLVRVNCRKTRELAGVKESNSSKGVTSCAAAVKETKREEERKREGERERERESESESEIGASCRLATNNNAKTSATGGEKGRKRRSSTSFFYALANENISFFSFFFFFFRLSPKTKVLSDKALEGVIVAGHEEE